MSTIPSSVSSAAVYAGFLALLPRIEQHGRIYFRHVRCPHQRAEALAEMVALAWLWYGRLCRRGVDPQAFPSALATFAARAVHSGRRLTGQESARDALSRRAQQLRGFTVEPLLTSTRRPHEQMYGHPHGQRHQDAFEERLRDNTQTPVPEQAAFRIDWPEWLQTRSDRDRRVITELAAGAGTSEVARRFGLTAGRVSQLRREFRRGWHQFHRDLQEEPCAATS